jgi:hypothetical protein
MSKNVIFVGKLTVSHRQYRWEVCFMIIIVAYVLLVSSHSAARFSSVCLYIPPEE